MGDGGGGHWFSPDGVAPSQMVSVSASINLPLHRKVQKFSSGTGSLGWSRKKGRKTVVVVVVMVEWYVEQCSVLFLSRPRSEGWPHHGRILTPFISILCHSD